MCQQAAGLGSARSVVFFVVLYIFLFSLRTGWLTALVVTSLVLVHFLGALGSWLRHTPWPQTPGGGSGAQRLFRVVEGSPSAPFDRVGPVVGGWTKMVTSEPFRH